MVLDQDNDGKDEVLFVAEDSLLWIVDDERGFQSIEIPEASSLTTIALTNLQQGHGPEILMADRSHDTTLGTKGQIIVFNPFTLTTRTVYDLPKVSHFHGIQAGDLDGDLAPELILTYQKANEVKTTDQWMVFDPVSQRVEWESPPTTSLLGLKNRILVDDLDQNGSLEILMGGEHLFLGYSALAASHPHNISGTVYNDDGDCLQDEGNKGMEGWGIIAQAWGLLHPN